MKSFRLAAASFGTVVIITAIAGLVMAHLWSNPIPTVKADDPKVFVASQICEWGDAPDHSADTCAVAPLYTVRMNKIAVIDSVSGLCVVTPPTTIREFQFQYNGPDGTPAQVSFPASPAVQNATNFYSVSITALNLRTYAGGGASGTPIDFRGLANAAQPISSPGYFCHLTVSGHYDD